VRRQHGSHPRGAGGLLCREDGYRVADDSGDSAPGQALALAPGTVTYPQDSIHGRFHEFDVAMFTRPIPDMAQQGSYQKARVEFVAGLGVQLMALKSVWPSAIGSGSSSSGCRPSSGQGVWMLVSTSALSIKSNGTASPAVNWATAVRTSMVGEWVEGRAVKPMWSASRAISGPNIIDGRL
jgi:hypothetical protein